MGPGLLRVFCTEEMGLRAKGVCKRLCKMFIWAEGLNGKGNIEHLHCADSMQLQGSLAVVA